jgi:hypothetical protein
VRATTGRRAQRSSCRGSEFGLSWNGGDCRCDTPQDGSPAEGWRLLRVLLVWHHSMSASATRRLVLLQLAPMDAMPVDALRCTSQ